MIEEKKVNRKKNHHLLRYAIAIQTAVKIIAHAKNQVNIVITANGVMHNVRTGKWIQNIMN